MVEGLTPTKMIDCGGLLVPKRLPMETVTFFFSLRRNEPKYNVKITDFSIVLMAEYMRCSFMVLMIYNCTSVLTKQTAVLGNE